MRTKGWRPRATAAAAAAVLAAVLLGACGGGSGEAGDGHDHGGDTPPAFEEAQATTTVDAKLRNFVFDGIPGTVTGPNVLFRARNEGPIDHELLVVDSGGAVVGAVEDIRPGASRTLAVSLPPGAYTVECRIKEGSKLHTDFGMKTSLTVE